MKYRLTKEGKDYRGNTAKTYQIENSVQVGSFMELAGQFEAERQCVMIRCNCVSDGDCGTAYFSYDSIAAIRQVETDSESPYITFNALFAHKATGTYAFQLITQVNSNVVTYVEDNNMIGRVLSNKKDVSDTEEAETIPNGTKAAEKCTDCADTSGVVTKVSDGTGKVSSDITFRDAAQIILPEGVTVIDENACRDCHRLEKIILPAGLKEVDTRAFACCRNLKHILLPTGITRIGWNAFYNCEALESITIPEGVSKICPEAFALCHNLKKVVIPESVTEIGEGAFQNCTNLEHIHLPVGITSIRKYVFSHCEALECVCQLETA